MSSYISCVYNSLWWVGLVNKVDEEQGDVYVQFMHPHRPRNHSTGHKRVIAAMSLLKTLSVLYRHLQQSLEELTKSVMKITTKQLMHLQNFIPEQFRML